MNTLESLYAALLGKTAEPSTLEIRYDSEGRPVDSRGNALGGAQTAEIRTDASGQQTDSAGRVLDPRPQLLASALPTTVPVKEPSGAIAPVSPAISAATEAELAPTMPPAAAPTPAAAPVEAPEAPSKTLGDYYGIDMADAQATPRHSNELILPAAISRAGSKLGAALAGVKADTSPGDTLYKQGAASASAEDKAADDYTNFKRQLMLRAEGGKKGANGKKYNDALKDPNSQDWKAFDAAMTSTETTRGAWERFKAAARANGTVPDANFFEAKVSNGLSGDTSTHNAEASRKGAANRQLAGFGQQEKMEGIRNENSIGRMAIAEEFKQLSQARDANVPGFVPAEGSTPTKEDGAHLKISNAKVAKVQAGLEELTAYVKAHPEDAQRWNPLSDEKSELSVLYGKVRDAYRVAEEFGVPSGKDMVMIDDVVKDPRRFLNIFTGRDVAGYETLKKAIESDRIAKAQAFGYVPSTAPRNPVDIVRKRVGEITGKRTATPIPSGAVLMSNGTETLEVPAGDVADAEKDGFKRVQ